MKKVILCLVCSIMLGMGMQTSIKANENESKGSEVCPFGMSSYSYYEEAITRHSSKQGGTARIINRSNTVLSSGSASGSRTAYLTFTGGGSAEFDLVVAKVGVDAEVSIGKEETLAVSANITNIPPNSYAYFKTGSETLLTQGKIITYDSFCNETSKKVNADYSVGQYIEFMGFFSN